jgi:hypothetical protein
MWWNIPVIPTTQEGEMGRSQLEDGLGVGKLVRPYVKTKLVVVVHTYNFSYVGGIDRRIIV